MSRCDGAARTGPVGTLETYVAEMSAQQQARISIEHMMPVPSRWQEVKVVEFKFKGVDSVLTCFPHFFHIPVESGSMKLLVVACRCVRSSSCVRPAAKLLQPLMWLDCSVAISSLGDLAGELLLAVPAEVRATALFGKASELLRGVAVGEVSPLPLSSEGRVRWDAAKKFLQRSIIGFYVGFRLAVEAVAFGASLFDAEDCLRSTQRTRLFVMQMRG